MRPVYLLNGKSEIGERMLGRGGEVYGYGREGLNDTFLIERPLNRDGSQRSPAASP